MRMSLDLWGHTMAWQTRQHEDPAEFARVFALYLVEDARRV